MLIMAMLARSCHPLEHGFEPAKTGYEPCWRVILLLCLLMMMGGAAYAQGEVNVMNPRYRQNMAPPQPEATPYQPRKRYDPAAVKRLRLVQPDSELGLIMPQAMAPAAIQNAQMRSKILIIGDSLAESLSNGMEADGNLQQDVTIIRKTSGASGLVRSDLVDWRTQITSLIAANRDVAVLVVMLGLNDNQPMREGTETIEPLSEGWNMRYRLRINTVLTAAMEAKIPVIWVGIPPLRNAKLSAALEVINALVRKEVEAAGQDFLSMRDAFGDEGGVFSLTGPDIMGDLVQLRAQDGIHFTRAGQRKLAFFLDAPLRRLLAGRNIQQAPAVPEPSSSQEGEAVLPPERERSARAGIALAPARAPALAVDGIIIPFPHPKPLSGKVQALQDTPIAMQLMVKKPPTLPDELAQALFDRGLPPPPRPGRNDDYAWR